MLSAGPIAQFCLPVGLFLGGQALFARLILKLVGGARVRGRLFSHQDFPGNPQGLAFTLTCVGEELSAETIM